MSTGTFIAFVSAIVCSFLLGICFGVLIEGKCLLKWFEKKLDDIEKQYKRKYGGGGNDNEKP